MTVTRFQDLPLAGRDHAWDGAAADRRVRGWTDAADRPTPEYRDLHVWYDAEDAESFGAYKLLIADVVDGRLKAVPHGIFAAAVVVQGGRGGLDVPEAELGRVRGHLKRYYDKLDDTPPWE
jgi:hypothetical protein